MKNFYYIAAHNQASDEAMHDTALPSMVMLRQPSAVTQKGLQNLWVCRQLACVLCIVASYYYSHEKKDGLVAF